jgi:hypothetical protein
MPALMVMRSPVVNSVPTWLPTDSGADFAYGTLTPTTGVHTVTFADPVTLSPGVDYWLVMQNCATNANAQGCSDSSDTFANIIVTPGMFYSFAGGGFGSADSARYPIFTANAVSGTSPQIGYSAAPNDYWGPSTIGQKFRVTAAVQITGLTAYWGGAAATGKFGLASSLA